MDLGRHTLHSFPLPGSGVVLAYILNILKRFNISPGDDTPVLYHRMAEAFKWGYAERSKLGDPADPEFGQEINKVHTPRENSVCCYVCSLKNDRLMTMLTNSRLSRDSSETSWQLMHGKI